MHQLKRLCSILWTCAIRHTEADHLPGGAATFNRLMASIAQRGNFGESWKLFKRTFTICFGDTLTLAFLFDFLFVECLMPAGSTWVSCRNLLIDLLLRLWPLAPRNFRLSTWLPHPGAITIAPGALTSFQSSRYDFCGFRWRGTVASINYDATESDRR